MPLRRWRVAIRDRRTGDTHTIVVHADSESDAILAAQQQIRRMPRGEQSKYSGTMMAIPTKD